MDPRIVNSEQDALTEGQRAGHAALPSGSNPYPNGTRKHAEWERGRRSVEARRLAAQLRSRARVAPCRYVVGASCECGGRGLCLDVA